MSTSNLGISTEIQDAQLRAIKGYSKLELGLIIGSTEKELQHYSELLLGAIYELDDNFSKTEDYQKVQELLEITKGLKNWLDNLNNVKN